MRVLTEPEAEKLICPYMSGHGTVNCVASNCVCWQPYSPSNISDILKSGFSFKGDQGFCDYNGRATPVIAGTVGAVNANK
jgi:hypothetical protein